MLVVRDSILGDGIGIGVESFFFLFLDFWVEVEGLGVWWGLVNVIFDNDTKQNI